MRTFLLFFLSLWTTDVFSKNCRWLPENRRNVQFCDVEDRYQFYILGKNFIYQKEQLQDQIQKEIEFWIDQTEHAGRDYCAKTISYWINIPEANPGAAVGRVTIASRTKQLVFAVPIDLLNLELDSKDVSVLEYPDVYPKNFGHSAGELLIKPKVGIRGEELNARLRPYNLSHKKQVNNAWTLYTAPLLGEHESIQALQKDDELVKLVEEIKPNDIMEWIAYRQKIFTFPWKCES